jgi:hypothetical protein
MGRRLIASLVVVACLLGIVQPALACANGASRSDCCPAGSPAHGGDQMRPAFPSLEGYSCCALPAAVAPSVWAVRTRTTHALASGSTAMVDLPTQDLVGQHLSALQTSPALIPYYANESQTYLRTARLRL